MTIMFGESLPALGLVGSNPLPAHFLYAGKLAEPELPKPLRGCHKTLVPMLSGPADPSGGNELLPLPFWSMKPTRHINLLAMSPEVPENTSNMLIATGAAGGDDGDKPPDGNHWDSHPEPQPDVPLALSPVKKCLQHKRQLLRMLRIKRLWATMTGQTTLARILSDRIMVTEADLLDLERSDPDTMHPGLIGRWLAGHDQELCVYREIISGKYSGRQAGTRKKNQPSRIIKASTTSTTGQMSGAAARKQTTGSAGDSGDGDDESLKPSAEQDTRGSVVTCSKCHKPLNQQELSRIANEAAVSAFLCNNCLAGTHGQKRARQPQKETEPDASEPDQKKKKGSGRKRN
ncbi:hypothetical protein, partial [Endozoicomonas sp. SESOKO2]|uniref:hypothetical protein n=1 Tax=Endozoicomonas sp. SESOKO2 TaxID=2828743 RepID=UPI0021492CA7